MELELNIYIDRLQHGNEEVIDSTLSPTFIDVIEPDLTFNNPVSIKGKAYLANEHLVIHLEVKTKASIPCTVCNKLICIDVEVTSFYHTEDLRKCKNRIYHYAGPLREAILLETPLYGECQGHCSERKELEKYKPSKGSNDYVQFPFADLN